MKKFLTLLLFSIILAPAPWGIAINIQSQQCAGYWGGDEYFTYTLPEGWQDYYPDESDIIHTPVGDCYWERHNWDQRAEKCCLELGYAYIHEGAGDRRIGGLTWLMFGGFGLSVVVLLLLCIGALAMVGLIAYILWKRLSKQGCE